MATKIEPRHESGLSYPAMRIACLLATRDESIRGLSNAALGQLIGYGDSSTQRALKELERAGIAQRVRHSPNIDGLGTDPVGRTIVDGPKAQAWAAVLATAVATDATDENDTAVPVSG